MREEDGPLDRAALRIPRAGAGAFEGVLESLLHRGTELEGLGDSHPAILGLRGSPLEAPENSITSLERALDLGQDGVAYDARACATGEIVLLRDAALDRTTDGRGALACATLPQVSTLDAGSWFGARFRGEPLALLEEALEARISAGARRARSPRTIHLVWLRERGLVPEVARILKGRTGEVEVRIASDSRETCLEIRDSGLAPVLILDGATEEARDFVRVERIAACAMPPRAWREGPGTSEWSCERWSIGVDSPEELLLAFRSGQTGLATREPLRALSTRALVALAPEDRGPYPIHAPELSMGPGGQGEGRGLAGTRGEWCGRWTVEGRVRNPFPFQVEVSVAVVPRHGAFEAEGVPRRLELEPGEEQSVPFRLTGGSWRPGGDPLLSGLFRWKSAKGRKAGALLLDAPLVRIRAAFAESRAVRLPMLRESPDDLAASMILRRRGRQLYVSIENPGGLADGRTIVHLDGRFYRGGHGVRVLLPEDFDRRPRGVAFSCGIEARAGETHALRRWAGGVPDADGAGSPGRLFARA